MLKTLLNDGSVTIGRDRIYRRILFGTDFSAASAPAFEQALKLASQNGAELLIAHSSVQPKQVGYAGPAAYTEWEGECRTDANKNIGGLIGRARNEGVKAHMLVLSGLADDAIVDTARKLNVDLIVIGTHGARGVSRLFLGSVAARVIARASCPVLTVGAKVRTRPLRH